MRVRSRRSAILVTIVGLATLLAAAPARPQAVVSIVPESGQFQCGQTWTVDVVVDAGATDLRGSSLVVAFDSNVIRPLTVTAGTLVTGAACPNFAWWFGPADADSVAFDVATLGCSVQGPGSVARITFEGYAGGTSSITLRRGDLRTGANAFIPFTALGAQVQYDCAVADRRETWGSLKALYR
jgi:hypothetical protein